MSILQKKRSSAEQHHLMTETAIPSLITKMALPMIVSQMISVIYNTVDTWFVAQISTSAAAAVGVDFALMAVIQAIGFALGMGANSIISRKLGEKKDEEAHRFASSAVAAGLVLGLLLTGVTLPFLSRLMRSIGASQTILPFACKYAFYILLAAPVMCMSFVMLNILRSQGKTLLAMWGICMGGIINTVLDPILIFRCEMGISGAALATALSQTASFLLLVFFFTTGKSFVRLSLKFVSTNPGIYLQIITTGLPTVFRQGLASAATIMLNIAAVPFGDAAVAAVSITNKIYLFGRHLVIGIGQGFQPVAGYNFGAGLFRRVREAFHFTVLSGTVLCLILAGFQMFSATEIMRFFLKDPEVIRIGVSMLHFMAMATPFMAYSTFVNQMYQCLGFKWNASFLASCRQGLFFFPLALSLPCFLGIFGIEILQPSADMLTFLISIPFQVHFYRKQLSVTEKIQG